MTVNQEGIMRSVIRLLPLLTLLTPAMIHAQDTDEEWLVHCRSERWNGHRPTACDVQVKTIPARSLLSVRPGRNGAVMISADNRTDIEIHARMQASANSAA